MRIQAKKTIWNTHTKFSIVIVLQIFWKKKLIEGHLWSGSSLKNKIRFLFVRGLYRIFFEKNIRANPPNWTPSFQAFFAKISGDPFPIEKKRSFTRKSPKFFRLWRNKGEAVRCVCSDGYTVENSALLSFVWWIF